MYPRELVPKNCILIYEVTLSVGSDTRDQPLPRFHNIPQIRVESKMYLCLMKPKIETRCPILQIQPFPERKFSHLNFAP